MTDPSRDDDPDMVAPATRSVRRGVAIRPTRWLCAAALAVSVVVAGCGVGRVDDASEPGARLDEAADARREVYGDVSWDRIDRRLDELVAQRGLEGAAVVVRPVDGDGHLHVSGQLDLAEPLPLAETTTWLTATLLLTLVDDGTLALDGPIGAHLQWATGQLGEVTLRQLLSHTSGLPGSVECGEPTPEACDAAIAAVGPLDEPGERFAVTALDTHVAARLAEAASSTPWAELVAERLTGPLDMGATSFSPPDAQGGLVAVDGTTTVDDLGRFLAIVRDGGRVGEVEVLSPRSVQAMLLDQTVRLDTHTEPWVAETGVPTYGLGVWRDRLRGAEEAAVVSAPNRWGLYPFVDASKGAWGIVVVDDHTSPRAEAVSESAVLSQLSAAMLRRPPDS